MKTFWLILVTIVWGSTFFIVKDTVATVNEYFIVFTRSAQAFIAMFIFQFIKDKKQLINKKALGYGSVLGVLLALSYASQTIGLKYTSTGHSAFITSSAVVIVPIILFFFYKTKLLKIDLVSVSIVLVGLFLLTYDFETNVNIGDIITIITAITYAIHVILAGRYVKETETLALITYQFFAASIVSLLAWLITDSSDIHLSLKNSLSLLYLGLIGTLFCYFITVWVQKYVSSLKVVIIFSLEPVFAIIFSYFIINEILNIKEMIGASLILLGVILHSILKNNLTQKTFNSYNKKNSRLNI
ncbi:MAG: DMT family transporter [Bacteroidales bacterium]|jgi:drug/metabolite transporter (DMT)-like permease|nr:DMT family transporter [Bacteroidales bacterium]